jgi:hypothetical protein
MHIIIDTVRLFKLTYQNQCLGGQSGIAYLISGGFSQLLTFALLLTSYYAFKRGASILDIGDDSTDQVVGSYDSGSTNSTPHKCPKCNGSGVFTWGREGLEECDLCDGSGRLALEADTEPLQLPKSVQRLNRFDDSDEE